MFVLVEISVAKNEVIITLDTTEKLLAAKRRLSIPKKNIESISTETVKPTWIAPKIGTHIPKGFMAGTFWLRGGKSFYYARDFSKCMTLKLRNHDYSRVVVQTEDKVETAKKLREALR